MKVIHRQPYEYRVFIEGIPIAELTSDTMDQDGLDNFVENHDEAIIIPNTIEGYPVIRANLNSHYDGERRIVLPKYIEQVNIYSQKNLTFEYPEEKKAPEGHEDYPMEASVFFLWGCTMKEFRLHSSDWFFYIGSCQINTLFLEKRFTTIRRTNIGVKKQQNKIKHLVVDAPNLEYLEGFIEMESLESVEIRRGVKEIKKGAFRGCKNLKKVTISPTVHSVGRLAFTDCHPDLQLEWRQNEQQPLEDFLDF